MTKEEKQIPAEAAIPFWKTSRAQNIGLLLFAVVGLYTFIYIDVVSRAKEACLEAEKYMLWNKDKKAKTDYFQAKFDRDKEALGKQLKQNKIDEKLYREKLDALEFDRDFHVNESSLKYAYQWYKDAYELFSPPESKWVRKARTEAPKVLALWKEELTAQGIPFEDYMFE